MIKALAIVVGTMMVAAPLGSKTWKAGSSTVHRIHDTEANVVCYVVPQAKCFGDCAYSPAISCVKLNDGS